MTVELNALLCAVHGADFIDGNHGRIFCKGCIQDALTAEEEIVELKKLITVFHFTRKTKDMFKLFESIGFARI